MVSNLLKRWQDDLATIKKQRYGFKFFEKKWDTIPSHSAHLKH
jgi:hypothetical protein